MSKISCDVTKDLLASYLDGVCSEESRGLVEEHLQECASCRRFVEKVQEQDLGKDAVKVDFLKRVRQSENLRTWLGIALVLALVFTGHPYIRRYQPLDWFYIAMPILMLIGVLMPVGGIKKSLPPKKEWIVPLLGTAAVCAVLGVLVMTCCFISGKVPMPCPEVELGSYLECWYTFAAVLSVVPLILSFARLKGRKSVFIVSQNIAWLGMNLALSCDTILRHMKDWPTLARTFGKSIIILILEFAVMTALMLVFYRIRNKQDTVGKDPL